MGTGKTYTVDCFFVSVYMQFGVIVGSIFVVLGFLPLLLGIRYYKKTKSPIAMILILCSLSYLIGGIFEENAPFGPGVRCYLSWFLYGYLKISEPMNQSNIIRGYYERNKFKRRTTN
jgi:hypothetical protein